MMTLISARTTFVSFANTSAGLIVSIVKPAISSINILQIFHKDVPAVTNIIAFD